MNARRPGFAETAAASRELPCDVDIEQALLGALMVDESVFERVPSLIPAHFYDPLHGRLWTTMTAMRARGINVTPLTLKAMMEQDEGFTVVGGQAYLVSMARAAPAMPNVKDYARILADLARRRDLIRIGENIVNTAFESVVDISAAAQIAQAEKALDAVRGADMPPSRRIEAKPFAWIDPSQIPTRQWLYDRHLIRGFPSATIAPGGTGKSSLIIAEQLAMSAGRPLLGQEVRAPLRCWYWNLEDPHEEITRRIMAACKHYGVGRTEIDGLHVSGPDSPCVIVRAERDGVFVVEPVVEKIVAQILEKGIDVLTIDPLVSCHEVGENDNGMIDRLIKAWGRIAQRTNCAIDLSGHTRKLNGAEATADDTRGAKALIDGVRSARVLNQMTKEQAAAAGVDNHRLYFSVSAGKVNLVPGSDRLDWYQLESVDLANGRGGPSDRIGVVAPWQWPDPFDGMSVADLFAVQKRIAAGEWKESAQAKNWAGIAVAEHLKLDLNDPKQKARCRNLLKRWLDSGALTIVRKLDDTRHERPFVEVGQWAA